MSKGFYKRTEYHKKRLRESHIGLKYPNKKMKPRTVETKRKISRTLKCHKVSDETKNKISQSMKGKNVGEKGSGWIDGRTKENNPYSQEWTDDLKESIRKRDGYTCQECGIHQDELKGFHKKLDVHHIDYDKDNLNPDNLISLCKKCHGKTNFNREYWIEYFKNYE